MKHVQTYESYITEWREPAPDTEYVTLYRGDGDEYKNFSIDKTSAEAILNQGLYFTDSDALARTYMDKGHLPAKIEWTIADASLTQEQVIDEYLVDRLWRGGSDIDYLDGLPASFKATQSRDAVREYIQSNPQEWKTVIAVLKRNSLFVGSGYVIEKSPEGWTVTRKATGTPKLTVLKVPKEWVDKCFNAEKPMSRKELEMCQQMALDMKNAYTEGDKSYEKFDRIAKDIGHMITGKRRASFMWLYREGPMSKAFYELENDPKVPIAMRRVFKEHGYKGLKYDGRKAVRDDGETVPKNTAYVFWDEQGINKLIGRSASKQPVVEQ